MANNFEAKHPRSTDGKFTEKNRKESGLTLDRVPEGEEVCYKEYKDYWGSTIREWEEKSFKDIFIGERQLVKEEIPRDDSDTIRLFKTANGYEKDNFRFSDGSLSCRDYLDKRGWPVEGLGRVKREVFWSNGKIARKDYYVTKKDVIEHFKKSSDSIPSNKFFNRNGEIIGETFYRKEHTKNGEEIIALIEVEYGEDGSPRFEQGADMTKELRDTKRSDIRPPQALYDTHYLRQG